MRSTVTISMWRRTIVGSISNRHGHSLLEKLNTFAHDLVAEPLSVVQSPIRGQVEVGQGVHKELSDLLETLLPLVIKICEHLVMHLVVQELLQGRPGGKRHTVKGSQTGLLYCVQVTWKI